MVITTKSIGGGNRYDCSSKQQMGLTNGYKIMEIFYEQGSDNRLCLQESAERSSL